MELPKTMKAVICKEAGVPEVLKIKEVPLPRVHGEWVLIKVKAFGLNRSELFARQGLASGVALPRVLGSECVGEVVADPSGSLKVGQKVAALLGGMGRDYDGSYAEYVSVPNTSIFPFESELDWATLGAMPEIFLIAWSVLHDALELKPEDKLLVRGGTSSIGAIAVQFAKQVGCKVIATSRYPERLQMLKDNGANYTITDDGFISSKVKELFPQGVNKILELIGVTTLQDSLYCAQKRGVVCMAGILSSKWVIPSFAPMDYLPSTVRLACYQGDVADLKPDMLQQWVDDVERGAIKLNLDRTFRLEEIVSAHHYMENNKATGKIVVVL